MRRSTRNVQAKSPFLLCALAALAAAAPPARAAEGRSDDADERELATAARLPTILRVVGRQNADLRELAERARAAEARAGAAARPPDPELKGELWGVPLAHPLSFRRSDTIMLGMRQAFPAWGTLDARERAGREDAGAAAEAVEARRQELAAEARRAFSAYARADREARLHLEHAGLTSRIVELARSQYQAGRGTQQDLLDAEVELARLHLEVAGVERQRRSSRALLNALMGRDADAPLGPAPETEPSAALAEPAGGPDPSGADGGLDDRRPELRAAARAVRRSEAALDLARREASLPALMVGADYWYMPMAESHHGYGAMVTMSLPWLNPRRRDEVRAAERAQAAERGALDAQRTAARFQLRDADAKLQAARDVLRLLHERVLAGARRSFESAEAQFQAGRGGVAPVLAAARGYLQVRIDEVRAAAELEASRADYARAAGLPVAEMAGGAAGGRP